MQEKAKYTGDEEVNEEASKAKARTRRFHRRREITFGFGRTPSGHATKYPCQSAVYIVRMICQSSIRSSLYRSRLRRNPWRTRPWRTTTRSVLLMFPLLPNSWQYVDGSGAHDRARLRVEVGETLTSKNGSSNKGGLRSSGRAPSVVSRNAGDGQGRTYSNYPICSKQRQR